MATRMIHYFSTSTPPVALLAAGLVLALIPSAWSQDQNPSATKTPKRALRVLAVGVPPPFRQEVRDGVRYEQEAEPGTIPPREVLFGTGESPSTVTIRLGNVSDPVPLAIGAPSAAFRVPGEGADAKPKSWLTLPPPPPEGDLLALIWRDPGKNWLEPRGMFLPDSAAAFPAGHLRIINLLPVQISILLDTEPILLDAGKAVVRAVAVGKDKPVQIAFRNPDDGSFKPFHHSSVLITPGDRGVLIVYRADGENPRNPAKHLSYNERPPRPVP